MIDFDKGHSFYVRYSPWLCYGPYGHRCFFRYWLYQKWSSKHHAGFRILGWSVDWVTSPE